MSLILSGTDGLSDVDGTASTPAIRGTDTNTGIFFPAADTIAFAEGGVEAMRLDSSGGVQIGRTSVIGTNNRLAIQMSGTTASGYTAASNAALAIDAGTATNSVLNLVGGGELGIYRSNSSGAFDVGIGFGDNSNRILRFDTAGTERMRITSAGLLQFNSGYGSVATAYGCRAWVNFNGTGTVAIRASGNVSSITDNGTGLFTANYTTAMPDGNYTSNITTRWTGSGDSLMSCIQGSSFSTSSISARIMDSSFNLKDPTEVSIAIFR